MHYLTIEQRESLQTMLSERAAALRTNVTRTLPNHAEETDDDAIVDLENALDVAAAERNATELEAIEKALVRLHSLDYGECADCGADIPFTRLRANPMATRCTACQSVYERTHAAPGRATL